MKESWYFEHTVHFKVGPARVWDALTNGDKTKQYMYGCEIVSDWQIGSPVVWMGSLGGLRTEVIKGELLELKTLKQLTCTVFPPGVGIADIPENYVTLSYSIFRENEGARLEIRQGDYAKVEQGAARLQDTRNVWAMVTPKLVAVAEAIDYHADHVNADSVFEHVAKLIG